MMEKQQLWQVMSWCCPCHLQQCWMAFQFDYCLCQVQCCFQWHVGQYQSKCGQYGCMMHWLCEHVATSDQSPGIMFGWEGGYQLAESGTSGNLSDAVVETVKAMMEQKYL
jgi:hypothetical protein